MKEEERERMRAMTIGQLLEMFEYHPRPISKGEWDFLRKVLCTILDSAAGFYDDFDSRDYEFALAVATHVIDENPPEEVIRVMAGTAHFMLNPIKEEPKEFGAETRARLERIRDSHPEFATADKAD